MSEKAYDQLPIGEARRLFQGELTRAVNDPARSGMPGSPADMLRNLASVVLDTHSLNADGTCVGCTPVRSVTGNLAVPREWPCDEIVRAGRIYGVWWARP